MPENKLERICLVGLGLLGGSLGLAVSRVWPGVVRVGYSHRARTREKALEAGAVDEIYGSVAEAVAGADLVILASPIGTFEGLLGEMAAALKVGTLVTDVGSTKREVGRWAKKLLGKDVVFVGSHPMAGSEQRGVDFARADLFEGAACIITPVGQKQQKAGDFLAEFWEKLGMRVTRMTPMQHDRVLGRISHLPHVIASALVNMSRLDELMLCGKGFLDTTRIASGPESVWHDILMTNADYTDAAIGAFIAELEKFRSALQAKHGARVTQQLAGAREKRNTLVEKKLRRNELPS